MIKITTQAKRAFKHRVVLQRPNDLLETVFLSLAVLLALADPTKFLLTREAMSVEELSQHNQKVTRVPTPKNREK